MTCSFLSYAFSDYEPVESVTEDRKEMRNLIGWVFIGIVITYITVNLFFILSDIFKGLLAKYR